MPIWKIYKHDSDADSKLVGEMPGNMSQSEVAEVMKRLVCRQLSEEEIVTSSLRHGTKLRKPFLDSIGQETELHFGENPYFRASLED
ncbi:MAG: hypothetical protein OQK00_02070 [Rhodobacteraceae bacterium]|nr:hypothetical protein [Paracoccaceae bacterium]MCW9042585.1 hypothetical protein [Pseudopelagicola sp.]